MYVKDKHRNVNMGVITIISDQGEFNSNAIKVFCEQRGLRHITTCAYTPEQNAVIERAWRTISEAAIALLTTANLSEPYWELARDTASFIRNRIVGGHPSTDPLSPFEKFYGVKPHISHFKIFGAFAYALIPNKLKNHEPKAQQGIFVIFADEKIGGYKVHLLKTNEFIVSCHVRFGTSPKKTTLKIEGSDRVDVSSVGKTLLGGRMLSHVVSETPAYVLTNPNVILRQDVDHQVSTSTDTERSEVTASTSRSRDDATQNGREGPVRRTDDDMSRIEPGDTGTEGSVVDAAQGI